MNEKDNPSITPDVDGDDVEGHSVDFRPEQDAMHGKPLSGGRVLKDDDVEGHGFTGRGPAEDAGDDVEGHVARSGRALPENDEG